jgi:hypothetical protein
MVRVILLRIFFFFIVYYLSLVQKKHTSLDYKSLMQNKQEDPLIQSLKHAHQETSCTRKKTNAQEKGQIKERHNSQPQQYTINFPSL